MKKLTMKICRQGPVTDDLQRLLPSINEGSGSKTAATR